MNVILDVDETLLTKKNDIIILRPYVREFIETCFNVFKSVSIWTANTKEHFESVYPKIREIMYENREFKHIFIEDK